MSINKSGKSETYELSPLEQDRIRAEYRYASTVASLLTSKPTSTKVEGKSNTEKLLGILSNSFILLLLGTLLSSVLIPYFQKKQEKRKQQLSLMQECFSQFLQFSNSIWQEYYTMKTIEWEDGISKETFLLQQKERNRILLQRYDSYAKVQSLAVAFRPEGSKTESTQEKAIRQYAVEVTNVSDRMIDWLTAIYCTPKPPNKTPCSSFNPDFDKSSELDKIRVLLNNLGNQRSDEVAASLILGFNSL